MSKKTKKESRKLQISLQGICHKLITSFKSNKKVLMWSVFNAVILIILSYFINNWPVFTGEKLPELSVTEWLIGKLNLEHNEYADSVVMINVSYDRQLTGKRLKKDSPEVIGNIDITDRGKLLSLLQRLKGTNYKYIFLDVAFERDDMGTPYDSALFATIKNMDRIAISLDTKHDNGLADSAHLRHYDLPARGLP